MMKNVLTEDELFIFRIRLKIQSMRICIYVMNILADVNCFISK